MYILVLKWEGFRTDPQGTISISSLHSQINMLVQAGIMTHSKGASLQESDMFNENNTYKCTVRYRTWFWKWEGVATEMFFNLQRTFKLIFLRICPLNVGFLHSLLWFILQSDDLLIVVLLFCKTDEICDNWIMSSFLIHNGNCSLFIIFYPSSISQKSHFHIILLLIVDKNWIFYFRSLP